MPTGQPSFLQRGSPERGERQSALASQRPLLVQYWRLVLRYKWLIVAIVIGALIAGLVATLLARPQFSATARVEISRQSANVTNVEGLDSNEAGIDLEFYQTQYALLRANSLADRIARELRLANNDNFFLAHGEDPAESSVLGSETSIALSTELLEERQRRAVELLLEHVSISPIRGSSLVDITYTIGSPELSRSIANTWARQYIEASMDRRMASTEDAREYLNNRLRELRARLEDSERVLTTYAARNDIVILSSTQNESGTTTGERTLISQDLETLNSELAQATADRIAAQTGLEATRGSVSGLSLNNEAINGLRQRRAEAQAEYSRLLVQFEPGYPRAKALAQQISSLETAIAREEGRVTANLQSAYRQNAARESRLQDQVDQLKSALRNQDQRRIQYNIYQREVDTNRQLYDSLLQRYKEIGVAGIGSNNIAIVDLANIPEFPSSPKLVINLLLALIGGTIVAGVTVLVLDQVDEGIREPSQIPEKLGMPVLGSVLDIGDEDEMALMTDRKSELSEAYLTVRSNLGFSTPHGVPRSIMVTSTREKEGKTTSSLALAMVLARTSGKTLLIDADMRSPSVGKAFGLPNKIGLSNVLSGSTPISEAVAETSHADLDIVPTGPVPPSAAELLSSNRLAEILETLSSVYRHIVVDAPPLLGLADAPLVSQTVEGVVFVMEAENVPVRGASDALARLNDSGARIFGVILTKYEAPKDGYGYGYGYGYGRDDGSA